MYIPRHYEETRVDVLHRLIREEPFAAFVTLGPAGLNANHVPFELDASPQPFGTLRGHVARANKMWRETDPSVEALVIFQGPQRYITPSWLAAKEETGKVTPTWNYVVVHAYGTPRFIEDPAWLRPHLERLTVGQEAHRPRPWQVSDAPEDFLAGQMRAIVGFELTISRLSGKWKVSQNRSDADRRGVAAGLRGSTDVQSAAIADLVERRP